MTHRFTQVDVFSSVAFRGNPVAVIHDAGDVPEETMRAIARWTNLSETTFLLPPTTPEADYRLRIFTPQQELPFAGHPTLGSARAWLEAGGVPRRAGVVVQECGAGPVEVHRDGDDLAFVAPPLVRSGPVDAATLQVVTAALGLGPAQVEASAWCDNGPGWLGLRVGDAATVLDLRPDLDRLDGHKIGVVGPHPEGGPADVEVRASVSGPGGFEDPVTGSLNAALAQWLVGDGTLPHRYTAAQGTVLGRAGRVRITATDDGIRVGGATSVLVSGQISPPVTTRA